ncbi:PIN domain-containing protein [Phreatobacter sp. AB_2022a]|uniref:PIN domain-containing protein n=1 Tax=Phreatobacter sp. AB_2022a TaxID=3003134 RepID=UPI00228756C7|nr:PIN domain-containing protein [Phreatobacter sp. AB_2022a]MCZ0737713.1 PIN domain-containing protein [Phreatobacter sp. AB_2022a]
MGRAVNVFADTNYFMHFKDPAECDWKTLLGTDVKEVRIIVGKQVQKELELKKYESKGRRQERAKKFSALLADAALNGAPFEHRAAGPRVVLQYVQRAPGFVAPSDLEDRSQDDQVIADMLSFNSQNVGNEAILLTNDPGSIARAIHFGVKVARVPEDWMLKPEADERQKELQQLKAELAEARRKGPKLGLKLFQADAEVPAIRARTWWMPHLTSAQKTVVLTEVDQRWPLEENLLALPSQPPNGGGQWVAPSVEDISRYRKQHSAWRASVNELLDQAVDAARKRAVFFQFEVDLVNTGVEPADHVRVIFELSGPFKFAVRPPKKPGQDQPIELPGPDMPPPTLKKLSTPPSPPQPTIVAPAQPERVSIRSLSAAAAAGNRTTFDKMTESLMRQPRGVTEFHSVMDRLAGRDALLSPRPGSAAALVQATSARLLNQIEMPKLLDPLDFQRDPQGFYWMTPLDKRHGATRWERDCDRFMHGGEPRTFELIIFATVSSAEPLAGQLHVTVTAKNQRETLRQAFDIHVEVDEVDRADHVRSALPK